jgi:hypothetical protein
LSQWIYEHHDLGEPALPDGSPVRRPLVPLHVPGQRRNFLGVIDSGSPISVADASIFELLGIDLGHDEPLYSVPLGLGGGFGSTAVYEVELELRPPKDVLIDAVRWRLHLAARPGWRLPFAILLGQRGWFDRFPTTIDGTQTSVNIG